MPVSVFGVWFVGLGLFFLLGCGYINCVVRERIRRVEFNGIHHRTDVDAPKWQHTVSFWTGVLFFIGLIMLAMSFSCLFQPGPLCRALYH